LFGESKNKETNYVHRRIRLLNSRLGLSAEEIPVAAEENILRYDDWISSIFLLSMCITVWLKGIQMKESFKLNWEIYRWGSASMDFVLIDRLLLGDLKIERLEEKNSWFDFCLLFKRRNGFEKLNDGGVDAGICSLKLAVVRFDDFRVSLSFVSVRSPPSTSSTWTMYSKVWV